MATKTRVPNKVGWALDEIGTACLNAGRAWRIVQEEALKRQDPLMLGKLGTIRDEIARIERLARDARNGEYREV